MNNFSCIITGTLSRNLSWNLEMLYWQKIYSWIYFIVYFSVTYNVLQSGYCVSHIKRTKQSSFSFLIFTFRISLWCCVFFVMFNISIICYERGNIIDQPSTTYTWYLVTVSYFKNSSLCSISVLYAMKEETLISHPLRTPDNWLQ